MSMFISSTDSPLDLVLHYNSLFMSIFVTITLHILTHYAYLLTITIVIYLVLSFVLSIDQHPSGTYNYLLTYIFRLYTTK